MLRMAQSREFTGTYAYLMSDAASYTSGGDIRVHSSLMPDDIKY